MSNTEKESLFFDDYKILLLIGGLIGLLIVIFFSLENFIPNSSNNATLVVEVGVGMFIAIIVFRATKKSEKNNEKTLSTIKKLLQKQEEHAKLLENQTLLNIVTYFVIIEERLRKMDELYPKLQTENLVDKEQIKKDIEGYRQNIHNLIKTTNNFRLENIRDKTLAYDINMVIRNVIGFCEIQVFADNPPSKYGVSGGLMKEIRDVLSMVPSDMYNAIPKEKWA